MRLLFLFIGFITLHTADHAQAGNPQYRCEPGTVANDAVTIAFPDVDVAAFSDPDNDVCTFAIGGASTNGPSRNSISPIGEIIGRLQTGEVEPLVLRLLLPRSSSSDGITELQKSIGSLLSENLEQVFQCFEALEKFDDGTAEALFTSDRGALVYLQRENDVVTIECSVFGPNSGEFVRSSVPVLRLYSRSQGKSDSLFIPSPSLR